MNCEALDGARSGVAQQDCVPDTRPGGQDHARLVSVGFADEPKLVRATANVADMPLACVVIQLEKTQTQARLRVPPHHLRATRPLRLHGIRTAILGGIVRTFTIGACANRESETADSPTGAGKPSSNVYVTSPFPEAVTTPCEKQGGS